MKFNSLLGALLISILFTTIIFTHKSSAEWAYSFVVWDGYVYVLSDEEVDQIGNEIGAVTKHSDIEDTYSGNFSNTYAKGTKYFSIKDVSTDEAIAIKDSEGLYFKATRDGEYAGNKFPIFVPGSKNDSFILLIGLIALLPILAFGSYLVARRNH